MQPPQTFGRPSYQTWTPFHLFSEDLSPVRQDVVNVSLLICVVFRSKKRDGGTLPGAVPTRLGPPVPFYRFFFGWEIRFPCPLLKFRLQKKKKNRVPLF